MPRRTKPKVVTVEPGPLKAYPRRGPDDGGRWYWQVGIHRGGKLVAIVDRHGRIVSGWFHRTELIEVLTDLARDKDWEVKGETRGIKKGQHTGEVVTLDQLLRKWVAFQLGRPTLRPATRKSVRSSAFSMAKLVGHLEVRTLRLAELEDALIEAQRHYGTRSIWRLFSVLGSAWKWGRTRGHVPDRELPRPVLPRLRKAERIRNHYTPLDTEAQAAVDVMTGWQRLFVMVLWYTGARLSEVGRMTWDKLRLDDARPYVDFVAKTETGTIDGVHRRVPLAAEVVEGLRAWRRERAALSGSVWPVTLSNIQSGRLAQKLAQGCEMAKVRVFTPHALRRLAATNIVSRVLDETSGRRMSQKDAEAIMGHTWEELVRTYAQVLRERVDEAPGILGRSAIVKTAEGESEEAVKEPPKGQVIEFPKGDEE